MKLRPIEQRLEAVLPLLTDRFTDEVALASVTAAGTTATATTSEAHGLDVGQSVAVVGVAAPVAIASATRAGEVLTVTTSTDHDLTERWFPAVTLAGDEFSGEFPLLTVPNRRTFTVEVPDSGPVAAVGPHELTEPLSYRGYSGVVTVTSTPTDSTFTYELPQALTLPGVGLNMRVVVGARIYSAINIERALAVFEGREFDGLPAGQLALFVTGAGTQANRDRTALNDGVSSAGVSGDNRQQFLQSVVCVVCQRVTHDLSGADAWDAMQDTARLVIQALAGWAPATEYARDSGAKLRFVSHDVLQYDSAVYAHVVEFQKLGEISNEDLEIEPNTVAFRDIIGTITAAGPLSMTIDLDEEPLP